MPADPPTSALDPPTSALDPPTHALDPPTHVADPAPPPADPPPARPRRRATAAELFERVIPDDPPTMPFGRAKRSDVDITIRRQAPQRTDEQLKIPFAGNEDETLPLGGGDATVPLGDDDTLPLDR